MAHFLRRAAATTGIRAAAAAITPAPYAASSRCPSATILRRLQHTKEPPVPAVPPEVRSELKQIEDDSLRRHRDLAADLAKFDKKVMEDIAAGFVRKAFLGTISAVLKEKQIELEANLESLITERVDMIKAQAFDAGRRSALLELKSPRPLFWRREDKGPRC